MDAQLIKERQRDFIGLNGGGFATIIKQVFSGAASDQTAIKVYCLMCKDKSIYEVGACADEVCPLHKVRPYRPRNGAPSDEPKQHR